MKLISLDASFQGDDLDISSDALLYAEIPLSGSLYSTRLGAGCENDCGRDSRRVARVRGRAFQKAASALVPAISAATAIRWVMLNEKALSFSIERVAKAVCKLSSPLSNGSTLQNLLWFDSAKLIQNSVGESPKKEERLDTREGFVTGTPARVASAVSL